MNNSPFCVLRTFPGCGSPCSSCSAAPLSPTACRRSRRVSDQELSVVVGERGREVSARNEPLGVRDSIGEVRRRDVEPSHALVQPLEGIRVVGWRDVLRCPGRVVGPERHCEAVTLVDARLHVEARERPRGSRSAASRRARSTSNAADLPGLPKRLGRGRRKAADAGRPCSSSESRSRCQLAGRALQQSRSRPTSHARRPMSSRLHAPRSTSVIASTM